MARQFVAGLICSYICPDILKYDPLIAYPKPLKPRMFWIGRNRDSSILFRPAAALLFHGSLNHSRKAFFGNTGASVTGPVLKKPPKRHRGFAVRCLPRPGNWLPMRKECMQVVSHAVIIYYDKQTSNVI